MFGKLRALWRLLHVLWMTLWIVVRLVRAQRRAPARYYELASLYTQRWGQRALSIMGVQLTVQGQLPTGPAIYVANHRSYIDAIVFVASVPCTMLSKAEVASVPIVGWGARHAGVLFVQRESFRSRSASLEAIDQALAQGRSVGLFPEGTTFAGPQVLPFKPGVFSLAAERGYTVVPAAIEYTDEHSYWTDDRKSMAQHFFDCFANHRIHVTFRIGPALTGPTGAHLRVVSEHWVAQALTDLRQQLGFVPKIQ